ncbi:MAG: hypothetical protein ACI9KE_003476 [Polyangiales bacterium]|jgi:hypothetical protein
MNTWRISIRLALALCAGAVTFSGPFLGESTASARRAPMRPIIEQVRPRSGPPGTEVTIIGRFFTNVSRVVLNGQEMTVLRSTSNRWVVIVPDGAQSGEIIVEARGQQYRGPAFRVVVAGNVPTVAGMTPASGAPGAVITIQGTNFGVRPTVSLNGERVVVRRASPTQIEVVVPRGATSGRFEIRAGRAVTESPNFTIGEPLAISRIDRPSPTELAIHGTGFSTEARQNIVTLGGRRLRVASATAVRIFAVITRPTQSDELQVSVAGVGRVRASLSGSRGPSVRGLSSSALASSQTLTVSGDGFGTDVRRVRATVGGQALRVAAVRPSVIELRLPRRRPRGSLRGLTLTVAGANVEGIPDFEWLETLRISDVSPLRGSIGTEVTIRGAGFVPTPAGNIILLDGVAQQVLSATSGEIRVRLVSAQTGTFEVQSGGARQRYSRPFVVQTLPSIDSFTPMSGPAGSEVTIRGTNFGDRSTRVQVELSRTPMPIVHFSSTEIRVRVPPNVRGGRITVQVGTEGGAASPGEFRVMTAQRVFAMEPAEAYPGVEVIFRGRAFPQGVTQVQFQGARLVRAQRISPVELRVVVPRRVQSGPVQLFLPNGARLEAGELILVETPRGIGITRVEPECVNPGCTVLLRGHGFDTRTRANRVTFEGARVEVISATAQGLRVRLPAAPGTGSFTVTVRRQSAQSPAFIIVPVQQVRVRRPR